MIDLHCGDALDVLRTLDGASVDCCVTSPPYDNLRQYDAGSAFDFEGIAAELVRVLRPGGVIVWVVGDETKDGSESGTSFRQALHFKAIGLRLHDTMIFGKSYPIPCGGPSRYTPAFEFMFVMSRGKPKVANRLTERCSSAGRLRSGTGRRGGVPHIKSGAGRPIGERKPRTNVWDYDVRQARNFGHPATFPLQLAVDHILSWTDPGDVVLDCFVGSGTTMEACLKTGRRGIGIEKSSAYHAIASDRIAAAQSAVEVA